MSKPGDTKSWRVEAKTTTGKRFCLRCEKAFKATGPFNRICPDCLRQKIFSEHSLGHIEYGFGGGGQTRSKRHQ